MSSVANSQSMKVESFGHLKIYFDDITTLVSLCGVNFATLDVKIDDKVVIVVQNNNMSSAQLEYEIEKNMSRRFSRLDIVIKIPNLWIRLYRTKAEVVYINNQPGKSAMVLVRPFLTGLKRPSVPLRIRDFYVSIFSLFVLVLVAVDYFNNQVNSHVVKNHVSVLYLYIMLIATFVSVFISRQSIIENIRKNSTKIIRATRTQNALRFDSQRPNYIIAIFFFIVGLVASKII